MSFIKDISFSAIVAGFVTVLVGFTSSGILVVQAAQALGATPIEIGSWMWALGLGIGLTCIGLSLRYKVPIATAWSTSGAAILIVGSSGVTMNEAVGAFMVSGALMAICGFTGWFERVMSKIPLSIAAAMLVGILLRFGLDVFVAMKTQFLMVLVMLFAYLFARRFQPRYAVIIALVLGVVIAISKGILHFHDVRFELATPVFVMPHFSIPTLIGIGLPLFVVTMASQNLPGTAALRAPGYNVAVSPIIGWIGLSTMILAPFGAYALSLAAITASICTGREAHEDAAKRYVAAVAAGVFYVIIGLFGTVVGLLFAAFPRELVLAIAGIALFSSIGNGLAIALSQENEREPALITFLVTASGITLFGIGSAFWGLVAGAFALLVLQQGKRQ